MAMGKQEMTTWSADRRYSGEVAYIFAYDVAYDTRRATVPQLLGEPVTPFDAAATCRQARDLARRPFRPRREISGRLREIRIDLARLGDELSNITKFFGDWHSARLYQALSACFHLGDWHRVMREKLGTLSDLYRLHKQDQRDLWMVILEVAIVVLFIIDVVILLLGLKGL